MKNLKFTLALLSGAVVMLVIAVTQTLGPELPKTLPTKEELAKNNNRWLGFQNSVSPSVCFLSILATLFGVVPRCASYSVLTHEAIIDAAWNI